MFHVLQRFQVHAQVPVTGVMDAATKKAVATWLDEGRTRVLRLFEPERILTERDGSRMCPGFLAVLEGAFRVACDAQDPELYGPGWDDVDDAFRQRYRSATWHCFGLAADLNFYSFRRANAAFDELTAAWPPGPPDPSHRGSHRRTWPPGPRDPSPAP